MWPLSTAPWLQNPHTGRKDPHFGFKDPDPGLSDKDSGLSDPYLSLTDPDLSLRCTVPGLDYQDPYLGSILWTD